MAEVHIQLPEDIRLKLNRTSEELARDMRLYTALMMFWLGKLSSGAAAELAGVPHVMFMDLCAEYGLPASRLTPSDLREEMEQWADRS